MKRDLTAQQVLPDLMKRDLPAWALLGGLVLAQICYPLTSGGVRAGLTVATVLIGVVLSVSHALFSRGPRAVAALIGTATLGGFAVEAVGVATGFPFGTYDYSGQLGPKVLGVPLIIPLAWTWMAWPAWLAALRVARRRAARIMIAAAGLAAWDLFLDPQMVAEGYWRWDDPVPALPGVPGIPVGNYLGWLGFAVLLMTALSFAVGDGRAITGDASGGNAAGDGRAITGDASGGNAASDGRAITGDASGGNAAGDGRAITGDGSGGNAAGDGPMLALWLWTYFSSVLAHTVFLDLPGSAVWGGLLMGAAVLPLLPRLRNPLRHHR